MSPGRERGFVLLDQFLDLQPGRAVVAAAHFEPDDPIFADHFPGQPIVPGALLTEAMAQAAGWLIAATLGFSRWPLLVMIDHAKFRRLVRPGEPLRVAARLRSIHDDDFDAEAEVMVDGPRVANARLLFHAHDFERAGSADARHREWAQATFLRLGGAPFITARGGHAS